MTMSGWKKGSMEKGRRRLGWIVAAVIVICAAGILAAALQNAKEDDKDVDRNIGDEQKNGLKIESPIGELTFTPEWSDAVQMEDATFDGQYTASFYSMVGKEQILLFEISVGDRESGYLLGSAPNEDGKMQNIWLNIQAIEPNSSWTKEETIRVNTIQSCVNDLIDQMHRIGGFVENK